MILLISSLLFCANWATDSTTFDFTFENQIIGVADSSVYWTMIAQDKDNDYCYLQPDGTLVKMSMSDNNAPYGTLSNCNQSNQFANFSYRLDQHGSITLADTTYLNSGIIYFSLDSWLPICVNKNADSTISYAPPSFTNPSLQGYELTFQAVEFTYNKNGVQQMNINTTNVDEMGIPIMLTLTDTTGSQQTGLNEISQNIQIAFENCPDTNFNNIVLYENENFLRILSPEHVTSGQGIDTGTVTYFNNFYNDYIDSSWNYYSQKDVTIRINGDAFTGKVVLDTFQFNSGTTFLGQPEFGIPKPSTADLLQADGVFTNGGTDYKNVGKFMAAAMYRTVFMETPTDTVNSWCSNTMINQYYTNEPINYYSVILHGNSLNGLCYAYAYDDVCQQSSSLVSTSTKEVKIVLTK